MNIQSSFDSFLKIIIVGDTGVGKSNFLYRFIDGKFYQLNQPTIGVDYQSKIIFLPKTKQNIKLQFWDTAGEEKYRSMNKLYFQRVQGIILMYDITNKDSFDGLSQWTKLIFENLDSIPIVLIGNKLDDDERRIVRYEEGKSFADENDFIFYEASALTGKNVNNSVYSLCEKIIDTMNNKLSFNVNNASVTINDIMNNKNINKIERKEPCC